MGRDDQAWAVFRCSLLSPLLLGEIPQAEREAYFRKLAAEERLLPNGQRQCVSVRTLRRWWKRLRDEGVAGTFRRSRSDRGQPRANQQALLNRAVELKKEQPRRSDVVINRILKQEFGRGVPRSTLYRHLHREGATRRKLGVSEQTIRCRWTRDEAGALWVGDFEHGPPVVQQGRAVKTHLSAWIDCHSRYIVEARYYLRENLDILVDSLLRAWSHHDTSRELYVDNAKIYHAGALKLACTELNIKLLHRPPRDPATGGLIERFFQTLQGQLEAEIRAAQLLSLGDINRALQAWLTQEYHVAVHSETKQTPHDRYHSATRLQRPVRLQSILPLFHRREQRTVDRDFSDVTILEQTFAVDPKLRGDRVEVRFDSFQTREALQEVQLFRLDGAYLGLARRYQREPGHHPQPAPPPQQNSIEPSYLNALQASHEASQQQRRQQGLDFQSAQQRNVWSLSSFATLVARLLGRTAGLSALSRDELDALRAFHARHDRLHEALVRTAVAQAEALTIPHVLWQLQSLLSTGDP
ncbi:MAG: transposase [Planctomycetaceae bacterium]|nr:transposase [Planctomycetaceae bacterium]MCB9924164.1 transposase [Planctomycetaceae bacterium]MCB9924506.1 transposase [Planctomycetaceae bacterium]MCB9924863.1 transposase [Planctomycetaceae bacterium]MCB9926656.1 transposase [Planctomycetaceae bacterium]